MATAARIFEERPYDAACFIHNRHPSILTGICIETQGLRGLLTSRYLTAIEYSNMGAALSLPLMALPSVGTVRHALPPKPPTSKTT
jgi:hypothetical protein